MLVWKRFLFNRALIRCLTTSNQKPWQPLIKKILTNEVEHQQGLNQLKQMVDENPKDISLLGRHLGLLYQFGSFMEMPELMEKIKKIDPNSLLIPYFEALIKLELGFVQETIKIYRETQALKRELKPIEMLYKSLLLKKLCRPLEAIKLIDTFLKTEEGKDDLEALLKKIELYLEAKQPNEALNLINKLLKDNPKNIQFRFYKGIALRDINEPGKSIMEFTLLLGDVTDPKRKALILMERSRSRLISNLEEKFADLKESKKLYPCIEIDREIIITYFLANKFEEAEPLLEDLEKRYNINKDYQMLLVKGSLLRYLKQDYKKALEMYKKIKELAPESFKEHFDKQIKVLEEKVKASNT